MNAERKPLYAAMILVLILGFFVLGIMIGEKRQPAHVGVAGIAGKIGSEGVAGTDFEVFWKTWNVLNEKFVPASTTAPVVNTEDRVWGAIKGLAASLNDPYTVFLPPEEAKLFFENINGNFEGVGMEVGMRHEILTVIAPLKGMPAEKAGVRAGDKIVQINGTITTNLSIDKAVLMIRGKKGTAVKLTLIRENADKPVEVSIVRDVIEVPTIETEVKTHATKGGGTDHTSALLSNIYVLRLFSFTGDSVNDFRKSLRSFIESGTNKLVIDLRGNPGGYLEAAVDMASWFLPSGKVVVRQAGSKVEEDKIWRSKGYDVFHKNLKLVILIDGGSASASEILAGALSEHGVATLVGTKTFGKGSVQELVEITPDTALKVTTARWLTPNGLSISDAGITPDVVVEVTAEDLKAGRDPQLDAAIEILTNGE